MSATNCGPRASVGPRVPTSGPHGTAFILREVSSKCDA